MNNIVHKWNVQKYDEETHDEDNIEVEVELDDEQQHASDKDEEDEYSEPWSIVL